MESLDSFYNQLKEDVTAADFNRILQGIVSRTPKQVSFGSIDVEFVIDLVNVNKTFCVYCKMRLYSKMRTIGVVKVREIPIDEMVLQNWQDDEDLRKAYYKLVKLPDNQPSHR